MWETSFYVMAIGRYGVGAYDTEWAHNRETERSRCRGPGVVAGSRTMHISNITDAMSMFLHITHQCIDSKKLVM